MQPVDPTAATLQCDAGWWMQDYRHRAAASAPIESAVPLHDSLPMPSRRLVAACLILSLLAACSRENAAGGPGRGGPGGPGGADRPVNVTTQVVRPTAFNDTLQALGTVRARESVTITANVSEKVERIHFDSGDVVRAGAPLVTLAGQAEQAGLREAQAAANEAERMLRRNRDLAEQQLIARSTLDTQRATAEAARARVQQIRAQLADRVVRAPFAGQLGLRQVSEGSLITPGTAITTLDDVSRVYVDFPVPETQLSQVAAGQRLSGTTVAYPGRSFEGVVATVDARVDPATRAVTVRGEFPNSDRALKPGMLLDVAVARTERQAMRVPEIAVVQVGGDTFVYRVRADGSVERADVELGVRRDGQAEVVQGLRAGDRIVVDGTGKLRPGAKVKDAPSSAAGPAQGAPAAPAGRTR